MGSGEPPGDGPNARGQGPGSQSSRPPSGGGKRAKAAAVVAATTVVAAVGVTGFLLQGGNRQGAVAGSGSTKAPATASASPTDSAPASAEPGAGGTGKPTVPGWKVVVNPQWGTAFDVPPGWEISSPDALFGFADNQVDYSDPDNWGKSIIVMDGPAFLQKDWCQAPGKDGFVYSTGLAAAGTKGAKGAKSTGEAAVNTATLWVYGGFTQPDTKSVTHDGPAEPYTTRSGVKGSIAWARSRNTPVRGKCAGDGKALSFGFKDSAGDFVAWSCFGATGVQDELPDSTCMKILSTVRLHGKPASPEPKG